MDAQPRRQDPHDLECYMGGLKTLQQRFPAFAQGEDMRSYNANRYFSPWLLFARDPATDLKENLRSAFELLLSADWALHDVEQPDPRQQDEVKAQQRDHGRRSARVDLLWSMWAMMRKLRMWEVGTCVIRGNRGEQDVEKSRAHDAPQVPGNHCPAWQSCWPVQALPTTCFPSGPGMGSGGDGSEIGAQLQEEAVFRVALGVAATDPLQVQFHG